MDKAPGKVAPEVTRESLIALSYSLPDQALSPKGLAENLNGDDSVDDGIEKYRSALIALSFQSPEIEDLPRPGLKS